MQDDEFLNVRTKTLVKYMHKDTARGRAYKDEYFHRMLMQSLRDDKAAKILKETLDAKAQVIASDRKNARIVQSDANHHQARLQHDFTVMQTAGTLAHLLQVLQAGSEAEKICTIESLGSLKVSLIMTVFMQSGIPEYVKKESRNLKSGSADVCVLLQGLKFQWRNEFRQVLAKRRIVNPLEVKPKRKRR